MTELSGKDEGNEKLTTFLSNVVLYMRKYQKENGIKGQCVANVRYLYDTITQNSTSRVKAKAFYVVSNDDVTKFVSGHLAILLDDDETVIDPSYDVFSLKNKYYFDNIKDLIDIFKNKDTLKNNVDMKQLVLYHLNFIKLADQINNGCIRFADSDYNNYYNNQADYINSQYDNLILRIV